MLKMDHNVVISRPCVGAVREESLKNAAFPGEGAVGRVVIESQGLLSQTRGPLKLTENDPWGISLSAPPH